MAKPINVTIKGDYTDRDINRAIRDLERLKTQSAMTGGVLGGFQKSMVAAGGALAAAFSFEAVISAMKDAAQAAMEDEKSMVALATAMDNVGLSSQNAQAEGLIESMMLQTGIADDRLRPAYQKLVTVTKDVTEAQGLLQTALDLSAAGYGDLESASKALSAAANGNFTALQRLKVPIDQAALASKDFDAAVASLNKTVGGQAAAAAQTFSGQMNRITVAAGEAKEAIGYALLNALDDLVNKLGGTGGVQQALLGFGNYLAQIITDMGKVTSAAAYVGVEFGKLTGFFSSNSKAAEILQSILKFGLMPVLAQVGQTIENMGIIWNRMPDWMKTAADATLGFSGATIVARAGAQGLATANTGLTSATVQSAIASGKASTQVAGLADDVEEAGNKAWYATQSYLAFFEALVQGQRAARDFANTSGTVSSAIAQGVRTGGVAEYWENLRQKYGEVEKAAKSAGSVGGAAAEELAIKWKQTAASINADVEDVLKVAMGGGGQVLAGALAGQFKDSLATFKAVVDAQVGIIRQAQDAINSYSKSVVDSILGGISISTTDAQGNALTPDQIVTALFGGIENRTKAVEAIAAIATKIPAALAQQLITLTATDPQGAIALANYLANNPAQLEQLTLNYNALSEFTKVALGDPMGIAFAQIGDESATKMIEDAKKKIADSATEFQAWVRSKLKTRITVEVEYVAVNVVPGARLEARADGGPVNGNQAYVVGEQGPEIFLPNRSGVIIPNSDLGGGGSAISGGNTYNINVSTGVGDPRQIGEQVVSYIKRFEAASGPVFARA